MKYEQLISTLASLHQRAATQAVSAVNHHLVLRNWCVGAYIVEYEQGGADRAEYGRRLFHAMAADLKKRNVLGLGSTVLRLCRLFYRYYPQIHEQAVGGFNMEIKPIHQPVIDEFHNTLSYNKLGDSPTPLSASAVLTFSWTKLIQLILISDPWKRAFYENQCIGSAWSVRQLKRQIETMLYERTALSHDKNEVIERARIGVSFEPTSIGECIRDPYMLEFVGLSEKHSYVEADLESALLDHLRTFLLELGSGFCFEARQFRVDVGTDPDRVDLVFYHRVLRCHVLIELKTRVFRPADAGQMNYYLNFFRANMMREGDMPPVGIILCCDRDSAKVEFATSGMDNQLFVSRYLVALPSQDSLRRFLEEDRERIERVLQLSRTSIPPACR